MSTAYATLAGWQVATLSQGMGKQKQPELAADRPDGVVSDTSDHEFELFVAAGFCCSEMLKNYYHIHPIWKSIQVAEEEKCHNLESSLSQVPRGQRSKGRGTEKVTAAQDAGMLHIALHIYPLTLMNLAYFFMSCYSPTFSYRIKTHYSDTSDDLILFSFPPSIIQDIQLPNQQPSHREFHKNVALECNDISIMAVSRSQLDFAAHPRKPRNVRTKRAAEPSDSEVTCERSLRSCRQLRRLKCSTTVVQKWGKLDSEKFEVYMEGHWFLLIFCHFGESPQSTTKRRCMLLLDSLQKANSKQLEPEIRRFVFDIFKIEARPEKKELISKIPLLIPKMKEDWFTHEEVESFAKGLDSMNETSAHSD
ncbi:UNVERIFIED_CONTAM: hypothetical protein Sindi_1123000 [Sesamum indicum]